MAIYKLGDIAEIKRGSSPRPINDWLVKEGLPWAKISDLNGNELLVTKEFVNQEWIGRGLIGNNNDLFITNSATPGVPFIQKNNTKIAYHDGFLKIIPEESIILKRYLLYKLIIDRSKLLKMGNGAVFINLSSEILKKWEVNIPELIEQQRIIDIIEPIEVAIQKILLAKWKLESILNNLQIDKTKEKNIFKSITTGKLDADAQDINGKNNFYTCSKQIQKTNFNSFNGRYIAISGNGNLFCWITNGEFDAYQRVYILKEKTDFYTTFFSVERGMKELRTRSNGAVIKFIKKCDIENITKYSNSHEKILEIIYSALEKISENTEMLSVIREKLIRILIK